MSLRGVLTLLCVLLVVFIVCNIGYYVMGQWIPAGHVGVMYSASSGLRKEIIPPKRVWVPWFHQLYIYPTLTEKAMYVQEEVPGESPANDGIQVTTNDNAITTYDITVYYRVLPQNVFKVFESFGPHPIEFVEQQHIRRAVKEAASSVGTQMDAFQLMGKGREQASQRLTIELQKRLGYKGLTIEKAMFCEAYPQQQLLSKIAGRVNSLTQLTISGIQADIAKNQKDAAVTRAKAEAHAAGLSATTTNARSLELLSLEAEQEAVTKWNGQLPKIQTKPGQTVFVPGSLLAGGSQ